MAVVLLPPLTHGLPLESCPRAITPQSITSSWSADTLVDADVGTFQRSLGDTELSYYLPSRQNGVNDMYLHIAFRAPQHLIRRERVRCVWAILRTQHPLLASATEMHDYNDVRFVYLPPNSPATALSQADTALHYCSNSKDDLLDSYLNGPRTLSNTRLSYLIISEATAGTAKASTSMREYHFFLCAAHFLGDGMALHQCANNFFGLLGGKNTQSQLDAILHAEWHSRIGKGVFDSGILPACLESNLSIGSGRFRQAVAKVDFRISEGKLIGGHSFPKKSAGPVHTVVPTVSFDSNRTKQILKNCKAHGVSISSALFAICNVAWARILTGKKELPMMMYSALNLRPYCIPRPLNDSYWFLAIGYFNVVLPSFLPSSEDVAATMWHRARLAKDQSNRAAKNPMVVSRSLEMARQRARNARLWAKEDDDKEQGNPQKASPPSVSLSVFDRAAAPSNVLIGLSLLGNLDGIYKHSEFPEIQMHTLTTGSRQRSGGMLMFNYTFAGRLWVSLGYDENGFDKEVVETFWQGVLSGIEEFLVS